MTLSFAAPPSDSLHIVWKDHFGGTTLNSSKWKPAPEWFRQGGSYWSDDNFKLNGNGQLILSVSESNDSVLAGAIRTHQLFDQTYGYFEVKCKLPQIKGGWAAFWMMPYGNHPGQEGEDGTEIDIFESINGWDNKIQHALHWDGYGSEHQKSSQSFTRADLYDGEFHTFGMWWTEGEYRFYIDDVQTWSSSAGGISKVPQYLKLTMEVSNATWPGDWNQQITKPIEWEIDYVKVYEWRDSSANQDQHTTSLNEISQGASSINWSSIGSHQFKIESQTPILGVEIFSSKGEKVFSITHPEDASLNINLENLAPGVYFSKIQALGQKLHTRTFHLMAEN